MGTRRKGVKRRPKRTKRGKAGKKKSVSKMTIANMIAGSGKSL